jgi:hypothetical protein
MIRPLPHIAGRYATRETADIIRARLEAAGLPTSLSCCDRHDVPGPVIGDADGSPAVWIPVTVWVLRTDYTGRQSNPL